MVVVGRSDGGPGWFQSATSDGLALEVLHRHRHPVALARTAVVSVSFQIGPRAACFVSHVQQVDGEAVILGYPARSASWGSGERGVHSFGAHSVLSSS